jgi:phospholipid/cholesterol/gamma-HCH transport system ATP-binding protein
MTPTALSFTLPAPGAPLIEVRGLWSVFPTPGGAPVVVHQDLDLTVLRGEVLTLAGGSGTGKTVLLRQILGLAKPARGTVTVLGHPVSAIPRTGAAARIGMLFQQGALFSAFTVLENIALPLAETGALPPDLVRAAALLKLRMVGLAPGDAHKLPAELSGGMVKRAALARALVMDPPLLLLDEPTAGLDPESSDAFCELLAGLHRELQFTVVMVTHDLDTLFALSSRVAVLAERRVIIAAPVPEVLACDHPFVRQFFWGERGRRAMARRNSKP